MTSFFERSLSALRLKGLNSEVLRGLLGVGSLSLMAMPLAFVASVLLARWLGPEAYGQYVFVLTVVTVLVLPIGPGLGKLVTREVARYYQTEDWGLFNGVFKFACQLVFFGSVIIAIVASSLVASNSSWSSDHHWILLSVATLLIPILGLSSLLSGTLRGMGNVVCAQLPEMLARPGLHLITVGSLVLAGALNLVTALASQVLAATASLLIGAWFIKRFRPASVGRTHPEYQRKDWARALLPFTLISCVTTLSSEMGVLFLGWLGDPEEIAALRVATTGAMLVAMPLSVVNMVTGPHIVRDSRNNDKSALQELSRHSARAALAMSFPIALPLIFFPGEIVEFVFGTVYRDMAILPLVILTLGQLINVGFGSVGAFLTMSGYERDTLAAQTVALLVNVIAAVLLVPAFGATGAAISVSVGLVTWNVLLAARVGKRLGIRPSAF